MNIIPETDRVIRNFLPDILQAAGHSETASELRSSDPIKNIDGIIIAVGRLEELTWSIRSEFKETDRRWKPIVEETLFWCKAAMWAAARQDLTSFKDHIMRICKSMDDGMEIITLN